MWWTCSACTGSVRNVCYKIARDELHCSESCGSHQGGSRNQKSGTAALSGTCSSFTAVNAALRGERPPAVRSACRLAVSSVGSITLSLKVRVLGERILRWSPSCFFTSKSLLMRSGSRSDAPQTSAITLLARTLLFSSLEIAAAPRPIDWEPRQF